MVKEKIIVTSALPYANGPIHLGHLSGAYLPADIYVRYKRLTGADIIYICGSDEHGVPITITADKEKTTPKVIIDRYHELNKIAFEKFGMDFDIYSRTSLPIHHETAKDFFLTYYKQNLFIEKKTLQFFDAKANMFLPDRYVEGTCPNCGFEEARSDECEKCGALYEPSELKNPKSKITGEVPVLKETSHWHFPLDKFQKRIEEYIKEKNEHFGWKSNVLQYCNSWLKEGLKDRAVTRDLDWGVPVPIENAKGKVMYVWFEAVLGYISATKHLFQNSDTPEKWREYWQDENTRYIAFIGKDNVVFHTIIFPAMLMAWNDGNPDKYVLPENVPANEFLNFEGKKFSKSRGWGIDVIEFLELFPPDPLRYCLAANLPENKDTDFYWKEFQARNNNELADILGNFINRTLTFTAKHFENKVPELFELREIDKELISLLESYPQKVGELINKYRIKDATLEVMNLARFANKYFNDSEPWITIKKNKNICSTTINLSLQTIYSLAELLSPFIPFTSEKIFKILNSEKTNWNDCGKLNLPIGHKLNKAEILFTKIEDDVIEKQIEKVGVVEEKKDVIQEITIEEFFKTQLKVAKILSAENVKKSDKLLKLIIEVGNEQRQLVAGIAQSYKPEELVGKKVVIVYNLKPAKLFGIESQGMILAVQNSEGKHFVLQVDDSVPTGTNVK